MFIECTLVRAAPTDDHSTSLTTSSLSTCTLSARSVVGLSARLVSCAQELNALPWKGWTAATRIFRPGSRRCSVTCKLPPPRSIRYRHRRSGPCTSSKPPSCTLKSNQPPVFRVSSLQAKALFHKPEFNRWLRIKYGSPFDGFHHRIVRCFIAKC